jgi:hypothetical protein
MTRDTQVSRVLVVIAAVVIEGLDVVDAGRLSGASCLKAELAQAIGASQPSQSLRLSCSAA